MKSTMNERKYKDLSRREFTKAAAVYETDHAGVYKICKKDYPDVLAELEKEPFTDLLDCGCGTAPMLTLLHGKYPEKQLLTALSAVFLLRKAGSHRRLILKISLEEDLKRCTI